MSIEDFRVTRVTLEGPDGKAVSRSMSVPEAIAWIEKQSGYSRVEVAVTADVEKLSNAVNLNILKAIEKARKDIKRDAELFLEEVRNECANLSSEVKRHSEALPAILSLVMDIEWDRKEKRRKRDEEERKKSVLASLRVEMGVPGRKCGTCGTLLSVGGIAYSAGYSQYLCASCGKQVTGTTFIVEPGDVGPAPPKKIAAKEEE